MPTLLHATSHKYVREHILLTRGSIELQIPYFVLKIVLDVVLLLLI